MALNLELEATVEPVVGAVTTWNFSSGLTLSQGFPSLKHVPHTGVFSSHFNCAVSEIFITSECAAASRTFVRRSRQPLQPLRDRTMFVFFGLGGAGLYIEHPRSNGGYHIITRTEMNN